MSGRILCGALLAAGLVLPAHAITFEERVAAQRAIEQVYWKHRIWPQENPGPKPPLSAVLSDAAIRARVEGYLRESNALERYWQRPITASALQAELDRMVKSSRDPELLRELFAALGDDPALIAETVARQTLADRLVRNWYAHDGRFHGGLKKRAEAASAACGDAGCMRSMGGRYVETTLNQSAGSEDDWERIVDRWAGKPRGRPGTIEETADGYAIHAVLRETADTLTIASVVWDKTPFDVWWGSQGSRLDATIEVPSGSYALDQLDAACTPDTWVETPYALEARSGHTAVWTGSEMIVWGGALFNSGGRYNPATDSWQQTSRGANAPSPRYGHSAVWTGTEMIVWGGDTTNTFEADRTSDTGGRYNPVFDTWTATSRVNVPLSRNSHTAVWTGSEMIVWGGVNPATPAYYLGSGARYNPVSNSWVPLPLGPTERTDHSAVWTGSEMLVWGGRNEFNPRLTAGARYKPATNSWQAISAAGAPAGRWDHTAVWTGTRMIVWGGISQVYELTGGRYDPSTDTWLPTSIDVNLPVSRTRHTAVWTGTEMIVWGGMNGGVDPLDSGGRYDPATDSWITLPVGLKGSLDHTAVWTESEMIVWGGHDFFGSLNTGARYKPSTNSWIPTSVEAFGEPASRRGHTAVWTGTEMIVWGGFDGDDSSLLESGGRYRPATNVWLPVASGNGAPAARGRHTAVWTGTEMIVWGGLVASGPGVTAATNSGGQYNPSTDSWQNTPRGAHVAGPRAGHVAAWTGTEMLVWGGNDNGDLGDGSRLNPATGSWSVIPTQGAPSARQNATGVWTGSELLVWGGEDASGVLDSGGRYAPAGNSWQPIAQAGAPSARSGHSSVWTGARMIVWGGDALVGTSTQPLNTGGRYDPVGDSWATTSVTGAVPTPRSEHTAVWTGSEMIVWGGGPDASLARFTSSGSRYDPSSDSWLPTSATGAPHARGSHSAVWASGEMIVWGGGNQNNDTFWTVVASGGRYCGAPCTTPATLYRDADDDGYGDPNVTQLACGNPSGWTAVAGDCADGNAAVHPGATEVCNQLDDDCDGIIDEDPLGGDSDADGVGNSCDNCPAAFNPTQSNLDFDGVGDMCDLDDGLIYVFAGDKTHIAWQGESLPTSWNVYEGDLAVLRATGIYTQPSGSNALANRRCGVTALAVDDTAAVPSGSVKFTLVTGHSAVGETWLGTTSQGVQRPNTNPCP